MPETHQHKYLVFLNEFSLLHVLWLILRHRDVYLIDSLSLLYFFKRPLALMAKLLLEKGWIKSLDQVAPGAPHANTKRAYAGTDDWYCQAEPVILQELKLDEKKSINSNYDFAASKQAINYANYYLGIVRFIKSMLSSTPGISFTIIGGTPVLGNIFQKVSNNLDGAIFKPSRRGCLVINFFLCFSILLFTLVKIIYLFRFNPLPRKSVFMAIDVFGDYDRMVPTVIDILGDRTSEAFFVFRNKIAVTDFGNSLTEYTCCPFGDGQFSIQGASKAFIKAISDAVELYVRFARIHPLLFLDIIKLINTRAGFEGLFNKYDIEYFWCRDQYNAEHIIRSQELRKRGGISVGIITGFPVFPWIMSFRFIDYDITHVLAKGPILKFDGSNWRNQEGVRQIGATHLPRAEIKEMVARGKSHDIVCFAKPYIDGVEYLNEIFEIGRKLPDRNISISIKRGSSRLGGFEVFMEHMKGAPENVKMGSDQSFDMIKNCRYVIAGESAIISEAISLGSVSFFLDTYSEKEEFVYREYPDLAYKSGGDIAMRIRAIEEGTWRYPIENFEDLADLSGWIGFDIIRRDFGLEPLDPPLLKDLWKNFELGIHPNG
jgi:hypothetical protein